MTDPQVLDAYPFVYDFVVTTEATTSESLAFDEARDQADLFMEDDNRKYEVVNYATVEQNNQTKQWFFAIKIV